VVLDVLTKDTVIECAEVLNMIKENIYFRCFRLQRLLDLNWMVV